MPEPCISTLAGTRMPVQDASLKSSRKKSAGRASGRGEARNFHVPFSDWNQGDFERSAVFARSADG